MTNEEAVKLATWKLLGKTDCTGCQHLYLTRSFETKFIYQVKCDCFRNINLRYKKLLVNSIRDDPNIQELKGMRCERYTPTRPEYE